MGGLLMKSWFTWPTMSAFHEWHTVVVHGLNLPRIGVNQATGEPEPDAQWTTAYTQATEVAPADFRAPVEDHVAAHYAAGLGAFSEPPPQPDGP